MADIRADLNDGVLFGRTVKRDRQDRRWIDLSPSKPHPFQPVSRLLAYSASPTHFQPAPSPPRITPYHVFDQERSPPRSQSLPFPFPFPSSIDLTFARSFPQASGNIGRPILKALLESNLFNVTVISRHESSATFPEGVTVVKSDFSPSHLEQTFRGNDAVVSTISTTAVGEQIKIVDAASKAGVKRFITSDFGSDVSDPAVVKAVPILGGKKVVVDHLRSKEKDGLTWSAIVNGAFTSFVSF